MLKTRYGWIGISMAAAATVVAAIYINQRELVFLTAKESVPVFATIEDLKSSSSPTVSVLELNQRVPVLKCIDTKEYQIYKVRLLDGKLGYVLVGKYELTDRDGSMMSC
jgi:hypothetical protein